MGLRLVVGLLVISCFLSTASLLLAASYHLSIPSQIEAIPERTWVCGDQNDDKRVDVSDAIIDLRIMVGLVDATPEQRFLSDVNHDIHINVFDAILTLQHIVGLREIIECGPNRT